MQPVLRFFSVSRILAMSSIKVGGKGYVILECWDKSTISDNCFSHPIPSSSQAGAEVLSARPTQVTGRSDSVRRGALKPGETMHHPAPLPRALRTPAFVIKI